MGDDAVCTRVVARVNVIIGVDVSKAKLDCLWLKDLQTSNGKDKGIAPITRLDLPH